MTNTIKTYVSTYEAYNNGKAIGEWVDLSDYTDADEFIAAMQEEYGEDAELMFQDYESDFDLPKFVLSESHIDALVWELLSLDEYNQDIVCAMLDQGYKLDYALSHYDGVIVYSDWDELIESWYEYNEVTDHVKSYIDEEKLKRDLSCDGYFEYNGKIYLLN